MLPSLFLTLAALNWLTPAAVSPGQRGVCVTEWTGGARWEIPVEVMGVLDAPSPDRTVVLVRLDDERFRDAGIVQGMSGSPVYIDGKLLGAVALGWSFAREPLAGVTPFADMRAMPTEGSSRAAAPPTLGQLAGLLHADGAPYALLPSLRGSDPQRSVPLMVSGLAAGGDDTHDPLRAAGFTTIPGAGRTDLTGVPEPGQMVAALLIWGDAVVAAGGTVTARDGDLLWAFGHPFLSLGATRLPAARARVVAVQTSYDTPFKFFSIGDTFGTFVTDRASGVVARIGDIAAGIPVSVTVHDDVAPHTWHFRMAEVPLLEPLLVTYLTNSCLTARGAATGLATVSLEIRVTLADGRAVTTRQAIDGADALARMSSFAGTVVSFLANSQYPHPAISAVDVAVSRQERSRGAVITEAIPGRTTVFPGETLPVTVRIQPADAQDLRITIPVTVPADAAPGRLDLIVADGSAWSAYRVDAAGIDPASFADQLAQVAMLESNEKVVVVLESRAAGAAIPGASQPALPPSWLLTLRSGLGTSGGLKPLRTAVAARADWAAPWPVTGAFRIPLKVMPRRTELP